MQLELMTPETVRTSSRSQATVGPQAPVPVRQLTSSRTEIAAVAAFVLRTGAVRDGMSVTAIDAVPARPGLH